MPRPEQLVPRPEQVMPRPEQLVLRYLTLGLAGTPRFATVSRTPFGSVAG